MELHQTFTIPGEIDQAWGILQDLERIAPCLPGAEIHDVDGDAYAGSVKVRLGPITIRYEGKARIAELDETAYTAVLVASGNETSGGGTARATVVAQLAPCDAGTSVTVDTDLAVTGKPAQFGRGVLSDVAEQLLGQFASCLSEELTRPDQPAATEQRNVAGAAGTAAPELTTRARAEAIDVLSVLRGAVGKEVTIAVAAAAAGAFLVWLVLRRTR